MLLNDEKVKEILKVYRNSEEIISYYFYGVITATAGKSMLLGNLASLAHTYYIVQVTNQKIDLVELDMSCKLKNYQFIDLADVKSVRFSNWNFRMGRKITLELSDSHKIKLKANKFVIGLKEQKKTYYV